MPRPLLILGAGGHGKVVADVAQAAGRRVVGFVDNDPALAGQSVGGIRILGTMAKLERVAAELGVTDVALAFGDNRVRLEHAREAKLAGMTLATLVHPAASVADSATLGDGTIVCRGAAICVEAELGEACLINTNAVVDHECRLGAGVHVAPAAALAGRVSVGEGAMIGIGASVVQCREIGAWSTVGAGAVVVRDIPPTSTAVGVPARVR